ncbi:putative adhesin [Vibrio aquimaris]|uniref:Putative adhesin Stv domain-containing protein n=1 Tax=Vibrio aquimaris TaxID=2587862 RepID=A0A5P9CIP4_9VIBR|nr:hypothetical protein [Vibrio aquimaris]QFT26130.1 hypothetical protein FIV01_06800 [Vibrio aquimaris]
MKTLQPDQQRVNREQTSVDGSEANRSHSSPVIEAKGVSSRVGVVDASGSSDLGNIKDYRIFKYQRRHSGGAETEANIVDAIINNRQGTTRTTDVLTVRERTFAFSEASLSDVFKQLDLKNS